MAFRADDLNHLVTLLESALGRFVETPDASVRIRRPEGPRTTGKRRDGLIFRLPEEKFAKMVRESWESDRRTMPDAGIMFPDDSLLTILFDCRVGAVPNSLKPVAHEIAITDVEDQTIGYIEKYSYCFYPNSRKAEEDIGYFRYDFHMDAMGDGDLGEHAHFHLHRTVDTGFRMPTGPMIEFDKIVSGIESVLAPQQRAARHQRWFTEGKFSPLLMDLTIDGIRKLKERVFPTPASWNQFQRRDQYNQFIAAYSDN